MTSADVYSLLAKANLAAALAILAILALRLPVRRLFGARAGYLLWLAAPAAAIAVAIPARIKLISLPMLVDLPAGVSISAAPTELVLLPTTPFLAVSLVWIAGVAASLAFLAFNQRRFVRSLGRLTSGEDRQLLRAEAAGVGPAVLGALSPKIVIPADFEARFDASERAAILAHEQAHIAAGHPLANGLIALFQCFFWLNPLAHLGAHIMRIDQELACDEAVMDRFPGDRRLYAEAMLKTQTETVPLPLGCYWPARANWALRLRIAMLKRPTPSHLRRLAGGSVAGVLAVTAGVGAWAAQPPRLIQHMERLPGAATVPVPEGRLGRAPPFPAGERQAMIDAIGQQTTGDAAAPGKPGGPSILTNAKPSSPATPLAAAATTPPPSPPALIRNPDWLEKPTAEDLIAAWPPNLPKSSGGSATLSCSVTTQGSLSNCQVQSESPAGSGAGDAAMRLSQTFRMKPQFVEGLPADNAQINIPFKFAPGP